MAGDWIKIRPSLVTSPKVKGIVKHLESNPDVRKAIIQGGNSNVTRNVMRNVTVVSLVTIWGVANEHSSNGVFDNYDLSDIDELAGVPGFGEAMESVGWLVYDAEKCTVTLPNFNEYNTCDSNRTKESNRERQRKYREKMKNRNVTSNVTRNVTDNVISNDRIEENRIESKEKEKKETPPSVEASPSLPKEEQLDSLINSWNELPKGIALQVSSRRSEAIVKGWKKVQRTPELKAAFADIPRLMAKIRDGTFLHGNGWFKFSWLFGKKNSEWNVLKILDGNYERSENRSNQRDPSRVTDEASRDALRFLE